MNLHPVLQPLEPDRRIGYGQPVGDQRHPVANLLLLILVENEAGLQPLPSPGIGDELGRKGARDHVSGDRHAGRLGPHPLPIGIAAGDGVLHADLPE